MEKDMLGRNEFKKWWFFYGIIIQYRYEEQSIFRNKG